MMSRRRKRAWIRTGLLLSALACGAVTTQFVPAYEEVASAAEAHESSREAQSPDSGVTGIDVDSRNLTRMASIS